MIWIWRVGVKHLSRTVGISRGKRMFISLLRSYGFFCCVCSADPVCFRCHSVVSHRTSTCFRSILKVKGEDVNLRGMARCSSQDTNTHRKARRCAACSTWEPKPATSWPPSWRPWHCGRWWPWLSPSTQRDDMQTFKDMRNFSCCWCLQTQDMKRDCSVQAHHQDKVRQCRQAKARGDACIGTLSKC